MYIHIRALPTRHYLNQPLLHSSLLAQLHLSPPSPTTLKHLHNSNEEKAKKSIPPNEKRITTSESLSLWRTALEARTRREKSEDIEGEDERARATGGESSSAAERPGSLARPLEGHKDAVE